MQITDRVINSCYQTSCVAAARSSYCTENCTVATHIWMLRIPRRSADMVVLFQSNDSRLVDEDVAILGDMAVINIVRRGGHTHTHRRIQCVAMRATRYGCRWVFIDKLSHWKKFLVILERRQQQLEVMFKYKIYFLYTYWLYVTVCKMIFIFVEVFFGKCTSLHILFMYCIFEMFIFLGLDEDYIMLCILSRNLFPVSINCKQSNTSAWRRLFLHSL